MSVPSNSVPTYGGQYAQGLVLAKLQEMAPLMADLINEETKTMVAMSQAALGAAQTAATAALTIGIGEAIVSGATAATGAYTGIDGASTLKQSIAKEAEYTAAKSALSQKLGSVEGPTMQIKNTAEIPSPAVAPKAEQQLTVTVEKKAEEAPKPAATKAEEKKPEEAAAAKTAEQPVAKPAEQAKTEVALKDVSPKNAAPKIDEAEKSRIERELSDKKTEYKQAQKNLEVAQQSRSSYSNAVRSASQAFQQPIDGVQKQSQQVQQGMQGLTKSSSDQAEASKEQTVSTQTAMINMLAEIRGYASAMVRG